jgi:hypothetical protein
MKPAALFSIWCLATACWMGSVSPADACTCGFPETLVARDASVAVYEIGPAVAADNLALDRTVIADGVNPGR